MSFSTCFRAHVGLSASLGNYAHLSINITSMVHNKEKKKEEGRKYAKDAILQSIRAKALSYPAHSHMFP